MAGTRSFLAFWMGGAGNTATSRPGVRSMLAFWMGGAGFPQQSVGIIGNAAITLGAATLVATGTVAITGSLAVTLGELTSTSGNIPQSPYIGAGFFRARFDPLYFRARRR